MRRAGWKTAPFACVMFALAACGSKGGEEAAAPASEGAAASDSAVPGEGETASAAASDTAKPAATAAAPATPEASTAKGGGAGDLSAYVGKWPFDAVNGVKWNDNPVVKAAIEKTVTDPAARKAIQMVDGPASTIELHQGKVASWSCEAHNCGDHQWNVMVDPKSGAADVCYHNEARTPGQSRWFLAGGKVETRVGNCSTE